MRSVVPSGAIGCALIAMACSEILGIETAHVDPSLTAAGGTSNATGGSTQTSAAGQSSGGAGGQAGTAAVADPCVLYCDTVTKYCQGAYQQYVTVNQCQRICSMFPVGSLTELDQNTVSCRLKYAQRAEYESGVELAGDCPAAGPGGGGRCGSKCDAFCTILMATCRKGSTDPYYYASYDDCTQDCLKLPEISYNTSVATLTTGNYTLECRLFHVTSAAMVDPEEHCGHAMGVTLCEPP